MQADRASVVITLRVMLPHAEREDYTLFLTRSA
jgi:hypothetical protein